MHKEQGQDCTVNPDLAHTLRGANEHPEFMRNVPDVVYYPQVSAVRITNQGLTVSKHIGQV